MVICGDKEEMYVDITATSFKARFTNEKASFKSEQKQNITELSKHAVTKKKCMLISQPQALKQDSQMTRLHLNQSRNKTSQSSASMFGN